MSKKRIMYEMTVEEVRNGLKEMKTIIVPIGVVEQHGYHLPLSTDIHNATEISARASELSGCFVAPCVHYNFSGGTLPGTINLSPQVYSLMLMDICRSLVVQGFRNIVFVLGHGGTESVKAATDAAENFQRLQPEMTDITISVVPFWELSPSYMPAFAEGDFHSGKYETSMMLYFNPKLVKMDKARLDTPELVHRMRTDQDAFLVKHKEVDSPFVVAKLTQAADIEVGVMGDFAGANAELGRRIAEEGAAGVADLVAKLEARFKNG